MKKIAKYFFAAVAMTAAVSCVKELDTEVVKPVEMTGKAYVFSASFDAETKTVLDEETLVPMWFGDQDGNEFITVMEPGSVNTYVAEGIYEPTAEVTFVMAEEGGPGLKGKAAFAVSPAGAWSCFNTADSLGVTVTYPQSQIAYDQTYDPAARVAVAYNEDIEANPHFNFKNASALLKFNLVSGSDPVTSVKFYSLGGEPLAGQMTLMVKDSVSMIVPAKGASSWVEIRGMYDSELDCDVDYYIAVAPSVLKKGIGFQFNDREDVQTFTISKEINIERNKIYDLGSFLYTASTDNKWYLVGNVEDGEVNTFANVMFQAEGDNLVAKNVTLEKGQSFKVLNPGLGQALYVNADEVVVDTWNVLIDKETLSDEEQEDFPFAIVEEKGTYDIYIDYAVGNVIEKVPSEWGGYDEVLKEEKLITGVALVAPGTSAPEYLSPEGMQFTWYDAETEITKVVDFGKTEEGTFRIGQNYDELPIDDPDPYMEGAWLLEGNVGVDVVYEKKHATSGYVSFKAVTYDPNSGSSYALYYRMAYSDLTDSSVELFASSRIDLEGEVVDENGDPVYDDWGDPIWYVSSLGICTYDEDWNLSPVTASKADNYLDILMPMPDENLTFVAECFDDSYTISYRKFIDLNIEEGSLVIADNYDQTRYASPVYDDDWNVVTDGYYYPWPKAEMQTNKWFVRTEYKVNDLEVIPISSKSGQMKLYLEDENGQPKYIMVNYEDYTYETVIALTSPLEIYDQNGEQIPVTDESGKVIEGAYWEGLGLATSGGFGYYFSTLEVAGVDVSKMKFVESYPETPGNAQWVFEYDHDQDEDYDYDYPEEPTPAIPACLDFGTAFEGKFAFALDADSQYGNDPTFPDDWRGTYLIYGFGTPEYKIIPDAEVAGSGVVELTMPEEYGGQTLTFKYYGYNGGMMYVTIDFLGISDVPVVLVEPARLIDPYATAI